MPIDPKNHRHSESDIARRRRFDDAMRRRVKSSTACCGYDPEMSDVQFTPREQRLYRFVVAAIVVGLIVAVIAWWVI